MAERTVRPGAHDGIKRILVRTVAAQIVVKLIADLLFGHADLDNFQEIRKRSIGDRLSALHLGDFVSILNEPSAVYLR